LPFSPLQHLPTIRIVGLKQEEGGELFLNVFCNFEGVEKANEESSPKE